MVVAWKAMVYTKSKLIDKNDPVWHQYLNPFIEIWVSANYNYTHGLENEDLHKLNGPALIRDDSQQRIEITKSWFIHGILWYIQYGV